MKEYRQKQPLKGRAASLDSDFKLNPIKPLVPLIGSSMKPRCDPLPDVGIPTYRSDGQGEIMDDMIKGDLEVLSTKTPLRDISNDQSVPNMEARITMASPNVSTVVLKRIDPKLRPPKKIIEASTSPSTNHGEDTMIHEDMLDDFDQGKPEVRHSIASIQVQWHPSLENWYKLNSDGSSLGNPGRAGGDGLFRDSSGAWVSGCARAIGHTPSVATELWALRDGINLCIDLNLTNVLIELDAKLVVDMLLK
nr:putative ribonuclease h protein [Quercus suber]